MPSPDLRPARHLWHRHPAVRSGTDLTIGERAADLLKNAMGTWSALGVAIAAIATYWTCVRDPGHLNLNLALSLVAAVQGIVLQIALNRGDRIASELAMHTYQNGQQLLEINEGQTALLQEVHAMQQQLAALTDRQP